MTRGPAGGDLDLAGHLWDVVVIGTGAGGATAGYALARQGRSVLFLERGKDLTANADVVRGAPWTGRADTALAHGWWPEPLAGRYRSRGSDEATADTASEEVFHHPLGCGTGGSTSVFGMVMDRFRPEDFTPRRFCRSASGSSLPDSWPISYDELAPFYQQAEALFRVRGTPDPLTRANGQLMTPPPAAPKETALSSALTASGLHPYRIHYAQDRVPTCTGCPGMLCPNGCRNDAGRVCLRPAIEQHRARLLSECRVVGLEEEGRVVRRAICEHDGRRLAIQARVFVLAANAFATPALLQRSSNDRFPGGLGNSSGLVGRNLMLHVTDFLLLRFKRKRDRVAGAMHHGLSLNDFYVHDGDKLGNVHAHSVAVGPQEITAFLRLHTRWVNRLPSALVSAMATLGARVNRASTVFATIVEDLPYVDNRVEATPRTSSGIVYHYRYPEELGARARALFQAFQAAVEARFSVSPLRRLGMLNYGHVCGTCRFGTDPATSVLDRDNRAHDLDNLYIVDGSFLPSSGGINPSLTIVANSLRVSETITRRL